MVRGTDLVSRLKTKARFSSCRRTSEGTEESKFQSLKTTFLLKRRSSELNGSKNRKPQTLKSSLIRSSQGNQTCSDEEVVLLSETHARKTDLTGSLSLARLQIPTSLVIPMHVLECCGVRAITISVAESVLNVTDDQVAGISIFHHLCWVSPALIATFTSGLSGTVRTESGWRGVIPRIFAERRTRSRGGGILSMRL